jgi:hypothetical protein
MNPVIVTVVLFGMLHLGALIFFAGDLKARVKNLELWKDKAGSEIRDVCVEVGEIKGHLGL